MLARTIDISARPAYLSIRHEQLQIVDRDTGELVLTAPCEDVGLLLVSHRRTLYSHAALTRLTASGAAIVFCGENFLPSGILLPTARHHQSTLQLRTQSDATEPTRKRMWQQIVRAKIRAQASLLSPGPSKTRLLAMQHSVKSGDTSNYEAHAARTYWKNWLPSGAFKRIAGAREGANSLLDYGYGVLRAAVARAIVGSGMHPALGVRHSGRSNAFCFADDLMEPLRPLVDLRVRKLISDGAEAVGPTVKRDLLGILTTSITCGAERGPLTAQLPTYTASAYQMFCRKRRDLAIPTFDPSND